MMWKFKHLPKSQSARNDSTQLQPPPTLHHAFWSKSLNVHFGYFELGKNPFRHELLLRNMNLKVATLLGCNSNNPPTKILDIGCGYGATMLQLQELFPHATLTGINNQAVQLQIAAQKIALSKHAGSATFMLANFTKTPFEEASFDAAYALESACYDEGETKPNFIAEAARLLRPGGRLVVVDGFKKHGGPHPRWMDSIHQKCLAAWEMTSLATIDGFTGELSSKGFSEIKVTDISWNILPTLIFIPIVATKLLAAQLVKRNVAQRQYLKALLLTLLLTPFKRHFGYFLVTCVKRDVLFEN